MPDLAKWHERGVTWRDFLARAEKNVERMRRFYDRIRIPEATRRAFSARSPLHVVAVGEDWCPDVVHNLALVARMADEIEGMDLRILGREENPELMASYLTNGRKRIPVLIFTDGSFREIGSWRGRCRSADAWILGEIIKERSWQDMSRDELLAFNEEYDRRYFDTYLAETLKELEALL